MLLRRLTAVLLFCGSMGLAQVPSGQTIPKPTLTPPTTTLSLPDSSEGASTTLDRFLRSRIPGRQSSADINDHEDAGILNDGGGPYTGVYAVHLLYPATQFRLEQPPSATDTQTLFAPTTRPNNGACIEVGTAYTTAPHSNNTNVEVYAFDFCKPNEPNWGKRIAITHQFLETYTQRTAQNKLQYALTIFTTDPAISSQSVWHAQLFNFKKNQWDEFYSSKGTYENWDPRGWSIFETWYQPGQCSKSLPELGVSGLAYFNPVSGKWEGLTDTMTPAGSKPLKNYIHSGGSCFVKDLTGPASYVLTTDQSSHEVWKVTSSGH